jgi:ribosomal protein S18 acetylase RimI-like enzyme
VDEQVVGYAAFSYGFYERGFIEMLHVARSHRGRGIGLALMAHLSQICKTAAIFTSTNQSNEPMKRLLAKSGFEPSGVIENLDEGDPELVYFKRLRHKTV